MPRGLKTPRRLFSGIGAVCIDFSEIIEDLSQRLLSLLPALLQKLWQRGKFRQ